MSESRRPILYKGELYSSLVEKKSSGRIKEPEINFVEARTKITGQIAEVRNVFKQMPKESRLPNEVVLCIRMHEDFSAKSYYPDSIFDTDTAKFGLKEIGSRRWTKLEETIEGGMSLYKTGKLFFVRATEKNLDIFNERLNKSEETLAKKFKLDVRRISSVDLLRPSEQILGIPGDWDNGRLEAVLHPFNIDRKLALDHFLSLLKGADVKLVNQVKYKQYGEGVTFISFIGNKQVLEVISGYNPLRTVHPLLMRNLPVNRGQVEIDGPNVPEFKKKSSIVVGVIDGGADRNNPYLKEYSEIEDSVTEPELDYFVSHGTQVCGTVLYGPLNSFSNTERLPEPIVSVKSFRVLSAQTSDPDLYDVVDAIEKIVPTNKDIKVYNLSLGPRGPILDDSISRFTFSCDLLSKNYQVLFCVAVGNDGEVAGYNRIQSPADLVNGLAVGAYTNRNGNREKAPYSCIGPGREGNKLKPDLLAFGGCDQTPIHLISPTDGKKVWNFGTSFACPIVSRTAGLIIGGSTNEIDTLVGRALIVHSVCEMNGIGHSINLGHGLLPDDTTQIITCPEKSYTLMYKGELDASKFVEFEIPWIDEIQEGKVNLRWTVAVLTDVDPQSPDDYTSNSIETFFYPNNRKYRFELVGKDGKVKKVKIVDIEGQKALVTELKSKGWKQSTFPVSASGKTHKSEEELRLDLKWDSLDTREVSKRASNLYKPKFHLHALGRGSRGSQKVKFALIVTVEAPSATIDLYAQVINKYNALVPLKLNIEVPVAVKVSL